MKRLTFSCLLLLLAAFAQAKEAFSYLYIQGDKQTPFYIKLEDAMQPRFGKNYCIVPQLAPGPAHIEILFQQNAFPAQQFTVLIPEGGSRGFLLVKKAEGFSLYDLQQGFYLSAGNKEEDDRLPAAVITANASPASAEAAPDASVQSSAASALPKQRQQPERAVSTGEKPVENTGQTGGPAFIPDMELPQARQELPRRDSVMIIPRTKLPAITNSDCPSAISKEAFGNIFNGMASASGDEDRLAYLMGRLDVCYESWQARALAQMLSTDAARYTLLKKIYPRITDQGAFPLLDDMLDSEVWKAEFLRLVRH